MLERDPRKPSGPQIRRKRAGGKKITMVLQNTRVNQSGGMEWRVQPLLQDGGQVSTIQACSSFPHITSGYCSISRIISLVSLRQYLRIWEVGGTLNVRNKRSQLCWCTPIVLALRKLMKKDHEFQARLGYIARPSLKQTRYLLEDFESHWSCSSVVDQWRS